MFKSGILRKPSGSRSLLDRGSIRMSMIPQTVAKDELTFSPNGYYDEDTDINEIHKYVMSQFQSNLENLPKTSEHIQQLEHRLANEKLQMIDRNFIQSQIDKLNKERTSLLNYDKQKEYLERITPFLENFNSMQQEQGPYFKLGNSKKFSPDKLSLIRGCIQIASEYALLNLTLKPINCSSGICPYCRQEFVDDEDDKIICYDCGIYQDALTHDAEFSDLSRINGSSNNNYMNRETFDKCKKCYQGQQTAEFPPIMLEEFNEYCRVNRTNISILSYETTRPIFKALKPPISSIKFSEYYEDINLFLFMHEGIRRPLPNITEYEYLIDQDYEQFYQTFIEIKGDERDSGLNAWYVLYILLRRRNIPCNRCDFKMPETKSIREANDSIAHRVFQRLGWKFVDTV